MSTTLNFEVLHREAQKDPVLQDMLHVLEDRQRTLRSGKLTVSGFAHRAKREGFEHAEKDYARRIKLLADAGLGVLDKTDNGKVLGLKHVTVDIRSFARAVLEKDQNQIKDARRRNRYMKYPTDHVSVETKAEPVPAPIVLETKSPAMEIKVALKNGNVVTVSLPEGSNETAVKEMFSVIAKLA